jgi:hypothetical protein
MSSSDEKAPAPAESAWPEWAPTPEEMARFDRDRGIAAEPITRIDQIPKTIQDRMKWNYALHLGKGRAAEEAVLNKYAGILEDLRGAGSAGACPPLVEAEAAGPAEQAAPLPKEPELPGKRANPFKCPIPVAHKGLYAPRQAWCAMQKAHVKLPPHTCLGGAWFRIIGFGCGYDTWGSQAPDAALVCELTEGIVKPELAPVDAEGSAGKAPASSSVEEEEDIDLDNMDEAQFEKLYPMDELQNHAVAVQKGSQATTQLVQTHRGTLIPATVERIRDDAYCNAKIAYLWEGAHRALRVAVEEAKVHKEELQKEAAKRDEALKAAKAEAERKHALFPVQCPCNVGGENIFIAHEAPLVCPHCGEAVQRDPLPEFALPEEAEAKGQAQFSDQDPRVQAIREAPRAQEYPLPKDLKVMKALKPLHERLGVAPKKAKQAVANLRGGPAEVYRDEWKIPGQEWAVVAVIRDGDDENHMGGAIAEEREVKVLREPVVIPLAGFPTKDAAVKYVQTLAMPAYPALNFHPVPMYKWGCPEFFADMNANEDIAHTFGSDDVQGYHDNARDNLESLEARMAEAENGGR